MFLKKWLIVWLVLFAWKLHAQQMPLYSQYMMNGFVLNPAIAGSDGFTTIGLSSRDHWVGFDNSPKTYVLSVQGRIMRSDYKIRNIPLTNERIVMKNSGRIGLGVTVFNDKNGAIERTGGQLTYAYHIFIQNTQLSFGLAVSTFQFKISTDKLKFGDPEPLLNNAYSNKLLIPDATFGIYVLTPTSFAGFSIANLFQTRIPVGGETYDYRMYRHYFLMAGKRFKAEELISYEPSFLIKATEKLIVQADLQMRFYYDKDYYMGICYRTGSAIGLLVGARWNRLFFGYAFDYSLTKLQNYTYGSHELNLLLKLGDNARRYRWLIRY